MRRMRKRLGGLAAVWLSCQMCLLVLASAALWEGNPAGLFTPICTCSHEDGHQTCPMHHPNASPSKCSCRSTNDAPVATLATMLGQATVLTHRRPPLTDTLAARSIPGLVTITADRPVVPDPRPPRA